MIPTLAEIATKHLCDGFVKQIDGLIINAMLANGLPTTDTFMKDNITCIRQEGDRFNHYWYRYEQPDAKRIISIEREPTIRYEVPDLVTNNLKQIVEAKYY